MGEHKSMAMPVMASGKVGLAARAPAQRARVGRPRGPDARYLNVRLSLDAFERLASDARTLSVKPGTLARRLIEQRSVIVGDSPVMQRVARSYHTLAANMNQIAWHANRTGALDVERVKNLAIEVAALRRDLARALES